MTVTTVLGAIAAHVRGGGAVVCVPVAVVWTAPDAPTTREAPVTAAEPDHFEWAARLDQAARLDLMGRTLTQALMWEPVLVHEDRGLWVRVSLPLQRTPTGGYEGWMRSEHITTPTSAFTGHDWVVLSERLTLATPALGQHDGRPAALSAGSYLPVLRAEPGHRVVTIGTPTGQRYTVALTATTQTHSQSSTGDLLTVASAWLGTGYLWGGLSGHGLDCSGLVHLASRIRGVITARDAQDQLADSTGEARREAAGGYQVTLTWAKGDLLFFQNPNSQRIRHVAIAVDTSTMLHAPRAGRPVELTDVATEPYASDLVATAPHPSVSE